MPIVKIIDFGFANKFSHPILLNTFSYKGFDFMPTTFNPTFDILTIINLIKEYFKSKMLFVNQVFDEILGDLKNLKYDKLFTNDKRPRIEVSTQLSHTPESLLKSHIFSKFRERPKSNSIIVIGETA